MGLDQVRLGLILATGIAAAWAAAFEHEGPHPTRAMRRWSRGLAIGASVALVACYWIGGR